MDRDGNEIGRFEDVYLAVRYGTGWRATESLR
jgi:hypothetical protein